MCSDLHPHRGHAGATVKEGGPDDGAQRHASSDECLWFSATILFSTPCPSDWRGRNLSAAQLRAENFTESGNHFHTGNTYQDPPIETNPLLLHSGHSGRTHLCLQAEVLQIQATRRGPLWWHQLAWAHWPHTWSGKLPDSPDPSRRLCIQPLSLVPI